MSIIPVKFLHTQLPTLSNNTNVIGSFIEKFDAFLSDGFNEQTFSSGEIKDNILTITHPENQGYGYNTVVAINDNSTLEGEYRVIGFSKTTTSIKVDKPNQTVTSFKVKVAPLGWTKHVISSTERIYTPKNAKLDHSLYLKDDTVSYLEVAIVRYTSGNIERVFPKSTYDPELNTGNNTTWYSISKGYFLKSIASSAQSNIIRSFSLIGDSKSFYYCPSRYIGTSTVNLAAELNTGGIYFYGEIKGIEDEYYTSLFCDIRNTISSVANLDIGHIEAPLTNNNYNISRNSVLGLVNNFGYKDRIQFCYIGFDGIAYTTTGSSFSENPANKGAISNKIPVSSYYAFNFNTNALIAKLPGMYYYGYTIGQTNYSSMVLQFFKGKAKLQDRTLLLKSNNKYSSNNSNSERVQKLFDIEGPWDN